MNKHWLFFHWLLPECLTNFTAPWFIYTYQLGSNSLFQESTTSPYFPHTHTHTHTHTDTHSGMIHNKIHLIRPGCLRPCIALTVQNCGLKQQSFHFIFFVCESYLTEEIFVMIYAIGTIFFLICLYQINDNNNFIAFFICVAVRERGAG